MEVFKVIVEKTGTGFSAYCKDLDGVVSLGKSWNELKENFKEAFAFHLEGLAQEGENIPISYALEFDLNVSQLFDYYGVFNVSALSDYLNLNPSLLHPYKGGHQMAPEKTALKILKGLHKFGEELLC